jgi:Flp pilus assembly protein TadG
MRRVMQSDRLTQRFLASEGGASAVEFGLIAGLLCFLLVGLIDFGMGYWEKIQVGNAARAGVQYAIAKGWDQTGISTAVTSATGLSSISASPAPTQACGCPSASSGIAAASCGSNCTGGGTAGTYVTVSASATYSTLLSYPGIASSFALTAINTVRIN